MSRWIRDYVTFTINFWNMCRCWLRLLRLPERWQAIIAEPVASAIIQRLGELDLPVHSLTFDNGKEFSGHQKIAEQLQTHCFFARPYHSWERGLNEHTNGLIRQYYPKGCNLATVKPEEVQRVQDLLNHRPRKSIGTPHEVFSDAILRQAA